MFLTKLTCPAVVLLNLILSCLVTMLTFHYLGWPVMTAAALWPNNFSKYRWHSFDKHSKAKWSLYVSSLWLTVSFEPKSLCLSSVRYRTLALNYIWTYFGKCQACQSWNVRVIGRFASTMCSEREWAYLREGSNVQYSRCENALKVMILKG